MTNKDVQVLKRFIKFSRVIELLPCEITNWPEKLSGKNVRNKDRQFTETELSYIESALLALADTIKQNATSATDGK